jgi:hypothetical protein
MALSQLAPLRGAKAVWYGKPSAIENDMTCNKYTLSS